jgi:hypothetical protein
VPELQTAEYKMYYEFGIFIKAMKGFPNPKDPDNQFVTHLYEDIYTHSPSTSSSSCTNHDLFARYMDRFIAFGSSVLHSLTTCQGINVISTTPILRVDISFQILAYISLNPNEQYPIHISKREFAINTQQKIRMLLNEVTSSYDIQFASACHNYQY